jgi:hypothetical protein
MAWCYIPDTACPSVQAAVDLTWVLTLPARALPPPAMSNGKNTPAPPSLPHSAPDTLPPRPSGITSKPLKAARGAASLTPCLPDTHASRFPARDKERAKRIPATSGPMWPASSDKCSPDGAFLKTSPATSPSALKPCCEPFGTWATRLRWAYSARLKSARHMKGCASLSWPTATASRGAQTAEYPSIAQTGGTTLAGAAEQMWFTPNTPNGGRKLPDNTSPTGMTPDGIKRQVGLENQTRLWTTPQAHDVTARGAGQVPAAKAGNACLATDAQKWTTPAASDGTRGGTGITPGMSGSSLTQNVAQWPTPRVQMANGTGGNQQGAPDLQTVASTWPTPAARDAKGENSADHLVNGTGRLHMDQLPNAVAHGFSRPAHLMPPHGPTLSQLRPIWRQLRDSLIASHGRAVWRRLWASRAKARLNPAFVEWLMGWPPGHASCACSEMAWCLWQQRMRGALSALPMACGPWIWKPPAEQVEPMQFDLFGNLT